MLLVLLLDLYPSISMVLWLLLHICQSVPELLLLLRGC